MWRSKDWFEPLAVSRMTPHEAYEYGADMMFRAITRQGIYHEGPCTEACEVPPNAKGWLIFVHADDTN